MYVYMYVCKSMLLMFSRRSGFNECGCDVLIPVYCMDIWKYVSMNVCVCLCIHTGGSFQGSLTLGKEYTINTYEGHVFFFTEGDDKTKEYARFNMNKEQVWLIKRVGWGWLTCEPPMLNMILSCVYAGDLSHLRSWAPSSQLLLGPASEGRCFHFRIFQPYGYVLYIFHALGPSSHVQNRRWIYIYVDLYMLLFRRNQVASLFWTQWTQSSTKAFHVACEWGRGDPLTWIWRGKVVRMCFTMNDVCM